MYVLNFRKCDKVININNSLLLEENYCKDSMTTHGFYFKGFNNDFLSLYIKEFKLHVKHNQKTYEVTDRLNFKIINDNLFWNIKCLVRDELEIDFKYKPYIYYPEDEDSETDVNFGLWIMSILNNHEKKIRFINANSSR